MCLSVPGKVVEVEGDLAQVSIGGNLVRVGLHLVSEVQVGDYVLVHTGFALEKISEQEALENLALYQDWQEQQGSSNEEA